jgi:tRNA(Arg) A34 adenosine deaminase TadA
MANSYRRLQEAHTVAAAEEIKGKALGVKQESYHGAIVVTKDSTAVAVNVTTQDRRLPDHHAEVRAMKKVPPSALHGATLYVARSCGGKWGDSRPCSSCDRAIRKAGVRRVVYTNSGNVMGVLTYS